MLDDWIKNKSIGGQMMKLANVSWGWTPIPEDMPEGDSLIKIADQIHALKAQAADLVRNFD